MGAGSGGGAACADSGVGAEIEIGRNEVWETVFVVMRLLNMWILHSAGRIVDLEFCEVLKERELGTLKEG